MSFEAQILRTGGSSSRLDSFCCTWHKLIFSRVQNKRYRRSLVKMVGCTRQASFDAASFREAFRSNSDSTLVVAMQDDQSIFQHSFVNALEIDIPRLVRGSSALTASSCVDFSLGTKECPSASELPGPADNFCIEQNALESVADVNGVPQMDEKALGITMPLSLKGKEKCTLSDECTGPSWTSSDLYVSGQELGSTPTETTAFRTNESSSYLSFRPSQQAAGVNYSQGPQERVAARKSPTSVLGGQPRWETKCKAIHCGLHARDYSDCMPFHLIRPLQLSPHQAMMNAVREALQMNRSISTSHPAVEMGKVTATISGCHPGLKMSNTGKLGNDPAEGYATLLSKEANESLQKPARLKKDGAGIGEKPASEHAEGRRKELPGQHVVRERFVRQRLAMESTTNVVDEDRRCLLDGTFTASYLQELSATAKIKNLIGYSRRNSRVGGCAVKPENFTRPVKSDEERRPMDDANLNRLLDGWENRDIFVAAKDSGDGEEERDVPPIVCRKASRKQTLQGFSGKCKVQITERGGNPLEVLGPDVVLKVLSLLDARSLARCGVLSKDWKALAHMDSHWVSQCVKLWEGKMHLPCFALEDGIPKVVAYSRSVQDAKRTRITREDLRDHVWEFRFKSAAPAYWLGLDPAQRGEAPMQRFFHMDGSQTAPPGDEVWGGHECFYSIINEVSADGNVEHFVQINHWPYMSVSRTKDWGWTLNNRVHYYQSMPDAWKRGGTGPVSPGE